MAFDLIGLSESGEEASCTEDVPQDAQCSLQRPEVRRFQGTDGAQGLRVLV